MRIVSKNGWAVESVGNVVWAKWREKKYRSRFLTIRQGEWKMGFLFFPFAFFHSVLVFLTLATGAQIERFV